MTPSGEDDNPFAQPSSWPRLPRAPLWVAKGTLAPPAATEAQAVAETPAAEPVTTEPAPALGLDEVMAVAAAPEPELSPAPAALAPEPGPAQATPRVQPQPPASPPRPARRELQLTPLIAAAAVGAGGLSALVLMIGPGRPPAPVTAAEPVLASLAVGQLVAPQALVGATRPAPRPTPPPQTTTTTTTAEAPPGPKPAAPPLSTLAAKAQAKAPPAPVQAARVALPPAPPQTRAAARPLSAALPAPRNPTFQIAPRAPVASLVGAYEPPLTPPSATPYVRPSAPDTEAPISTHVPDAS